MKWDRSTRIKTLLAIDTVFFFLEIIVGYAVGSLALVADSFHMLNDVCSLLVALYAIKLSQSTAASEHYSYGWQRAEVLGALINGVFLLALCLSICLEAVSRLFGKNEVSQPKWIVVVGSLGLLSNMVGLLLFHEHGHSHGGGGGHSHGHSRTPTHKHKTVAQVEEGRREMDSEQTPLLVKPRDVSPAASLSGSEIDDALLSIPKSPLDNLFVHPAQARDNVIRAAAEAASSTSNRHRSQPNTFGSTLPHHQAGGTTDHEPCITAAKGTNSGGSGQDYTHSLTVNETSHNHDHDVHANDVDDHGGHEEGSMNMRGVFLHVLGDALGNIGVIAAGLIIWLTDWKFKFYFDPLISLVITLIILASAMPLVRSASFILLQGTPFHIPLSDVRSKILDVPGVLSVHELHIWSLSESKLVASVHVLVESPEDYTRVTRGVRKALHRCGIHSSTIQPELVLPENGLLSAGLDQPRESSSKDDKSHERASSQVLGKKASMVSTATAEVELGCQIPCAEDCGAEPCCPTGGRVVSRPASVREP